MVLLGTVWGAGGAGGAGGGGGAGAEVLAGAGGGDTEGATVVEDPPGGAAVVDSIWRANFAPLSEGRTIVTL